MIVKNREGTAEVTPKKRLSIFLHSPPRFLLPFLALYSFLYVLFLVYTLRFIPWHYNISFLYIWVDQSQLAGC